VSLAVVNGTVRVGVTPDVVVVVAVGVAEADEIGSVGVTSGIVGVPSGIVSVGVSVAVEAAVGVAGALWVGVLLAVVNGMVSVAVAVGVVADVFVGVDVADDVANGSVGVAASVAVGVTVALAGGVLVAVVNGMVRVGITTAELVAIGVIEDVTSGNVGVASAIGSVGVASAIVTVVVASGIVTVGVGIAVGVLDTATAAHSDGYGTIAGAARLARHRASKRPTHERQLTISSSVTIAASHDSPPGTVTAGQVGAKPMAAGVRSSAPPHDLSAPPHARQVLVTNLSSTAASAAVAPASGHGPMLLPRSTLSSHWKRIRVDFMRKSVDCLPSAR